VKKGDKASFTVALNSSNCIPTNGARITTPGLKPGKQHIKAVPTIGVADLEKFNLQMRPKENSPEGMVI